MYLAVALTSASEPVSQTAVVICLRFMVGVKENSYPASL